MPHPPPTLARQHARERAEAGVDIVVVGGGITGAGVARDLTLRGARVLLVDRDDWAAGTSSKSSKLIHGGLRYLADYHFGLVMESTRERRRQRQLNPHLVTPLPFVLPVFKQDPHSLGKISLGMWLYATLALFRVHKRHKRLSREQTLAMIPGLRADDLTGAVHYYDFRTDDARLTLANVLAAQQSGALTLSRTCLESLEWDDEQQRIKSVRVRDVSGLSKESDAIWRVPTKHVVFAAGPWTGHAPGTPPDVMRLTKGVHVVVDFERLPVPVAVAFSGPGDGRGLFAIPLHNTTYIGTTDSDVALTDDLTADANDVSYLLDAANQAFPDAKLQPSDVRSTWSGMRPLIRDDAPSASKTSREHRIYSDVRGTTTVAGGKLTTYRAMAEQVADRASRDLKDQGVTLTRCTTHKTPLDAALPTAPSDALAKRLWHAYGSRYLPVLERIASEPSAAAKLTPELPYTFAEVDVAVRDEQALELVDVLVRRTQVFYRAADCGLGCARAVADRMAVLLGHDPSWAEAQTSAFEAYVARELACIAPSTDHKSVRA